MPTTGELDQGKVRSKEFNLDPPTWAINHYLSGHCFSRNLKSKVELSANTDTPMCAAGIPSVRMTAVPRACPDSTDMQSLRWSATCSRGVKLSGDMSLWLREQAQAKPWINHLNVVPQAPQKQTRDNYSTTSRMAVSHRKHSEWHLSQYLKGWLSGSECGVSWLRGRWIPKVHR